MGIQSREKIFFSRSGQPHALRGDMLMLVEVTEVVRTVEENSRNEFEYVGCSNLKRS